MKFILFISIFVIVAFLPQARAQNVKLEAAFESEMKKTLSRTVLSEEEEEYIYNFRNKNFSAVITNWPHIPEVKMRFLYRAMLSYSLSQAKLYQASVEEWLLAAQTIKTTSDLVQEMDQFVTEEWPHWVLDKGIFFSQTVSRHLNQLSGKKNLQSVQSLKLWGTLYQKEKLPDNLKDLIDSNAMRKEIVRRNFNELIQAKKTAQLEKLLSSVQDPLYQARWAFEKGDYKKAKSLYESMAKNDIDYMTSREELAWTYYHLKDWPSLMGLNTHMEKSYVPGYYQLETRALSAMVHLDKCDYASVQKEVMEFQKFMTDFAGAYTYQPLGYWAQLHNKIVQNLKGEAEAAQNYNYKGSYASDLKEAQSLTNIIQKKEKVLIQARMQEALLKMRFVKIELLSQTKALEKMQLSQTYLGSVRLASNSDNVNWKTMENDKIVFAANPKEFWADEVFQLKSLSSSQCHKFFQRRTK